MIRKNVLRTTTHDKTTPANGGELPFECHGFGFRNHTNAANNHLTQKYAKHTQEK